jgi:hypothetical protein
MTRRQLDIGLATGGALFALLVLGLGLVLRNQGDFAKSYVKEQLGEQRIMFPAAEKLTDTEKTWKSGSVCLVENGGKLLETGAQAECYANYYINLHLEESATRAGYPGETYASIGAVQTQLRTQVADAKATNDPAAADLEKQLTAVNALRDTQFRGETLRGLLLTSYGFSIFGERAALAANLAFGMAAVVALLAIAGFVHAFVSPKDQPVLRGRRASAPVPITRLPLTPERSHGDDPKQLSIHTTTRSPSR